MKTFYAVKHITTNEDTMESGYYFPFTSSTLGECEAFIDTHYPRNEQDMYNNAHTIRFVESYELDPSTDTWVVTTTERPVYYAPTTDAHLLAIYAMHQF